MIFFKSLLCLIVYSMPFLVGFSIKKQSLAEAYLFGQMLVWSLFYIVSVPMILLHMPFMTLFISFVIIYIVLSIIGIIRLKNGEIKICFNKENFNYYLFPALFIILFQAGMFFWGQHLDEDDSRWIAEACDALDNNVMLLNNPATGAYVGSFKGEVIKDVFSPWPLYIATISRMTFIRPAVTAHTVFAPVLLGMMYLVYYLLGNNLFKEKFERAAFLLLVSIVVLFFNGNRYTQATFTLSRIWQGKAVVAAVVIPLFLLVLVEIEKDDTIEKWLLLIICSTASCLFSGMGISISLILTGLYGCIAVFPKRIKRIPFLIVAFVFPTVFGLLYYFLFKI